MNAIAAPVLAAGIMDLNPGLTLWTVITFLVLIVVLVASKRFRMRLD